MVSLFPFINFENPCISPYEAPIPLTNNSLGNSSELEKPGSQQAQNQSEAQDKHTKHCEQGLYLAENS
jgi:hypothetical protein